MKAFAVIYHSHSFMSFTQRQATFEQLSHASIASPVSHLHLSSQESEAY